MTPRRSVAVAEGGGQPRGPLVRPEVSVVVPAYNAAATLGATLDALEAQEFEGGWEVIVVDDGSDDRTAEIADGRYGVKLLKTPHSGPAAARNIGVARAVGRVLAFTDADCVPPPNWLAAGVAALAGADLVQGAVRPDPAAPLGPFDHTVWVVRESGLYETASLFIRREVFESAGGFVDPVGARLGKQLAEDVWLGWRVRRAGGTTRFIDDAVVDHAVIPRSATRFVVDRLRQWYFPAIVRLVPELRRTLFWARVFLSARSAAFDLALAAVVVAIVAGSPLPAIAAAPYLAINLARARGRGLHAPRVALAEALADFAGALGLLAGSIRSRRLVL